MSAIDYVEVTATVNPSEPWTDLLIAELGEIGFESFEETLRGFKAYIPSAEFNEDELKKITIPGAPADKVNFSFSFKKIDSQNWNEVWESNFEPVEVSDGCYIRASFHPEKPGFKYQVVIEPKMSFGTGHHETTHLMVQWMLETDFQNKKTLDMGCGTGILAILARMMGANPVTAIDNYIFAYENTLENIERNATPDVKVLHGDATLLGAEQYDIILANITRNVLLEDIPSFAAVLNKGGRLFLSGFFHQDMQLITDLAAQNQLKTTGFKQVHEWVAVNLIKE